MRVDRPFFDTNIFVYELDEGDKSKQAIAAKLVHENRRSAIVSTQVLVELYNVLVRKLRVSVPDSCEYVRLTAQMNCVETDATLVMEALELAREYRFSIWDSMMVAAAQRARCDVLFTEDLSHGQKIGSLTVVNPFLVDSV
jgi:predicted nucleic acid-binding protein